MMVPILNTLLLSSTHSYVWMHSVDAQSNLFPTIFNHTYVHTYINIIYIYIHTPHKMFKVIMSKRHILFLIF